MAEEKKNGNGKSNGGMCSCVGSMGCGCASGCGCGCGGHGHRWTFFLLRTLLTILILMIVFWFGALVGRLSTGGFDRLEMMHGYYPSPMMYNQDGASGSMMMPINGATTTPPAGRVQNY